MFSSDPPAGAGTLRPAGFSGFSGGLAVPVGMWFPPSPLFFQKEEATRCQPRVGAAPAAQGACRRPRDSPAAGRPAWAQGRLCRSFISEVRALSRENGVPSNLRLPQYCLLCAPHPIPAVAVYAAEPPRSLLPPARREGDGGRGPALRDPGFRACVGARGLSWLVLGAGQVSGAHPCLATGGVPSVHLATHGDRHGSRLQLDSSWTVCRVLQRWRGLCGLRRAPWGGDRGLGAAHFLPCHLLGHSACALSPLPRLPRSPPEVTPGVPWSRPS